MRAGCAYNAVARSTGFPLPGRCAGQFGFTLVELIVVMVVIGLLGAVAAPRFMERKGFDAVSYTDQARGLIRYGQKLAIAQNRNVYVRLDGASAALCYDAATACAQPVLSPSGSNSGSSATRQACAASTTWACEGVPSGLTMTSHARFYFDPSGKPFLATDGASAVLSTFTTQTVVVSGDGLPHNILITTETGYVH
jgi:MSHA pilin protein MshC